MPIPDLDATFSALAGQPALTLVGRGPRMSWWDPRDFASELARLHEPAVLRALGEPTDAWLELPLHVDIQWEAELAPREGRPVGQLGGLHMYSLLDAWSLRDDPDWRAPAGPEHGARHFLIDIDNYHGNGDFTVAVIDDAGLHLEYCDGHVFIPLAVTPLEFYRVGLQALGWPSWQKLFAAAPAQYPAEYERAYLRPMIENLPRWLPDHPRSALDTAIAAWRRRHARA